MNDWYDFTEIDSVTIIRAFITIITLFCMVYISLEFFMQENCVDEGTVAM
jgi:hypothetical protein